MLWFYTLRRLCDGAEWSGRYPGDQTAVWDLSAAAEIRCRLASSEEALGAYVLERYRNQDGNRGHLIAEVNVITIEPPAAVPQ
jgi:hypothetical protein